MYTRAARRGVIKDDGYEYHDYETGREFGDNRKVRDWADRAKYLQCKRYDWERAYNSEIERYVESRLAAERERRGKA